MGAAILGLGFGDEGKGLTTSFVCDHTTNPLVVRFNGGHQAGHTVVHEDTRHVFSSFGSGTLQGVPTYWSSHCTFSPQAFLKERDLLVKSGVEPVIYVNPLAMVTTPFDVMANKDSMVNRKHGTVGVGFGTTIKRNGGAFKLYAKDLFFPMVCKYKLEQICYLYGYSPVQHAQKIEEFMNFAQQACMHIEIRDNDILSEFTPVYEGAQGILLDMDHGFFPNVTRSHTTSKNAFDIGYVDEIYYVTRSYLTRHGAGYLPDEEKLELVNNENETNVTNDYQGEFRTAKLNIELLRYAIASDAVYSGEIKRNLVITCLDQYEIDVNKLVEDIGCDFDSVYLSYTPCHEDMVLKGEVKGQAIAVSWE